MCSRYSKSPPFRRNTRPAGLAVVVQSQCKQPTEFPLVTTCSLHVGFGNSPLPTVSAFSGQLTVYKTRSPQRRPEPSTRVTRTRQQDVSRAPSSTSHNKTTRPTKRSQTKRSISTKSIRDARDRKYGAAYSSDITGDGPRGSKGSRKNQRNRPPPRRQKKPKRKSQNFPIRLSACAAHYAATIATPFLPSAVGACVPTFPARLTQKVSAKMSGQFVVGTKQGFLAVTPCVANDQACIFHSDSGTYAGTSAVITPSAYVAGTGYNVYTTVPYNNVPLLDGGAISSSTLKGRVVSVGVRVRYTGTELYKGGTLYALIRPDHETVNDMSPSGMASYKECIKVPVSRKWTEIVASAVDPDETIFFDSTRFFTAGSASAGTLEYISALFPFSQGQSIDSTSTTVGAPIILFMATGNPGNTFEYEIIQHLEYIGSLTQSVASKSHADADGLSMVTDVAGSVDALRQSSGMSQATAFATNMVSFYRENRQVLHAGASLISSLMAPGLRGRQIGL